MIILKVILLALIQGITEFLPISSSGHLVLAQHYLGLQTDQVTLDVILHAGTLVSILIFFRNDILALCRGFRPNSSRPAPMPISADRPDEAIQPGQARRYWGYILIAILPAGFIGALLDDWIEAHLFTLLIVSPAWIINGINLWFMDTYLKKEKPLSPRISLLIGLCQCIAILPGISRSGTTIAAGVYAGLNREASARFSFLIAIPVIGGAAFLKLHQLFTTPSVYDYLTLLIGFTVSALSGYAALKLLFLLLSRRRFRVFAVYCLLLGLITGMITYL
ncbi:MAG: undecaprenyl-diphosphate phosphatase [Candidatus Delongbacteria bacterium]|nr:undecaprenyl-diphosphate phosphatase [Candidatus Delongbacteria bacterium]